MYPSLCLSLQGLLERSQTSTKVRVLILAVAWLRARVTNLRQLSGLGKAGRLTTVLKRRQILFSGMLLVATLLPYLFLDQV
jgi:hypothetical protein